MPLVVNPHDFPCFNLQFVLVARMVVCDLEVLVFYDIQQGCVYWF
jgi:hypothetical protein